MIGPKAAVIENCKYCTNSRHHPSINCENTICFWYPIVNNKQKFSVKQIHEWCLKQCVGGSISEFNACTGSLLNGKTCPLHPFKNGRNPKRKGMGRAGGNPDILKIRPKTQSHGQ